MKQIVAVVAVLMTLVLAGCNPCPKLTILDATHGSPALIEVLFAAECHGEPIDSLRASDVKVYEGGEEVSAEESDWSLERHSASLETYTLLLIDISKSIIESGTLETAQSVATSFTETLVAQNQTVAVAVFDGDSDIRTVVPFTSDLESLREGIEGINESDQLDESTNLNGAVEAGLAALDLQVETDVEGQLMSVGNLVLFTDGLDSANRVTDNAAVGAVRRSDHQVFVVGLVGDDEVAELSALAKDGFFQAGDEDALLEAFEELAESLVAEVNKYYRFSYCSPLRSPRTKLTIEVMWEESIGSISYSYPTRDFGAGCTLP